MQRFEPETPNFQFRLRQIRSVAQYQLGLTREEASNLFPGDCTIKCSKKTGKVRFVELAGDLLCTLKPTDGLFTFSLDGARRLLEILQPPRLRVVVQTEIASFIREGRNVFAKHVLELDPSLRPGDEAIIVDGDGSLLGVGKLHLTSREAKDFQKGVAVHTRHGKKV